MTSSPTIIYCKKEGWKDWVLLEENLEKNEYEWDTTGIPSGLYQIKVDRQRPQGQRRRGRA